MKKVSEGIFAVEMEVPQAPKSFALFGTGGAIASPFGKHELDIVASFLLAFSWTYDRWVGVDAKTFFEQLDPAGVHAGENDELARVTRIAQSLPWELIVNAVHALKDRGLINLERTAECGDILWPTPALISEVC